MGTQCSDFSLCAVIPVCVKLNIVTGHCALDELKIVTFGRRPVTAQNESCQRQALNFSLFTSHTGFISSDLGRFEQNPADAFYAFSCVCRIGLSYVTESGV